MSAWDKFCTFFCCGARWKFAHTWQKRWSLQTKIHKFSHALWHELIWHFIDDLQSRRANEMRRTYLILRKSSKSPNHASSSGNNGQTRHLPPLHSIQIYRYGLLSFTLSFCIFPFHFFLLPFATAAVQMFVTNRTAAAAEESLPHSPFLANAQVSEMILATFTLALLICNLAAMSMLMPRLAKLLCNWGFVRAQSGDKPSDANALKRNYLCLTFQHPRL